MTRSQEEKCLDGLYALLSAIHEYWHEMLGDVDGPSYKVILSWIANFPFSEIDKAIYLMRLKIAKTPGETWTSEECVRYISGIMWKRKREKREPEPEPVIPDSPFMRQ